MKIIIEVSGKEYKVTETEARHVYEQLKGLFGEKELTNSQLPLPHNPHKQYGPIPHLPPIFSPQQPMDPYNPWKITCSGGIGDWGG